MTIFNAVKIFAASLVVVLLAAPPTHAATTFPGTNGLIAFSRNDQDPTVWLARVSGNARQTSIKGDKPVWSPSGDHMILTRHGRLYVASASGAVLYPLQTKVASVKEYDPAWSADGTRVAFVTERKVGGQRQQAVVIAHLATKHLTVAMSWSADRMYASPTWSPNGSYVAYRVTSSTESSVRSIDVRRGTSKRIVAISDKTAPTYVAWSPDGNKIVYSDSVNEVYTVWHDGSRRATIADGDSFEPSWSPDGSKLVFLEAQNGEGISVSEADGTVVNISVSQGRHDRIMAPQWSPDGKSIAFLMHDSHTNTANLFAIKAEPGAQPRIVARDVSTSGFSWQSRP